MDNAVLFREQIKGQRGRRDALDEWLLLVIWLVPLVALWLARLLLDDWTVAELGQVIGWIVLLCAFTQVMYLCSRCLSDAAYVIAGERDRQTLELLTCSPLGSRRLLGGYFMAIALPRLAELTVCLPLTFELLRSPLPMGAGHVLGFYLLSCCVVFFFTWLGLLVSAASPSVAIASQQAFAAALLVFLCTFLLDFDCWALGHGVLNAGLLNPCTALFSLLGQHNLMGPWNACSDAPFWLVTCALYVGGGLLMWAAAVRLLDCTPAWVTAATEP